MKKIVDIFAILGVIASVASAYIAYLAYKNDSEKNVETGVRKIQVAIADVIAPSNYSLTPKQLDIIPENTEFTISKGDTALITRLAKLPFAIRDNSNDFQVHLMLNGKSKYLSEGNKIKVEHTNCFMWLYHISNPSYSFQLRCGEKI